MDETVSMIRGVTRRQATSRLVTPRTTKFEIGQRASSIVRLYRWTKGQRENRRSEKHRRQWRRASPSRRCGSVVTPAKQGPLERFFIGYAQTQAAAQRMACAALKPSARARRIHVNGVVVNEPSPRHDARVRPDGATPPDKVMPGVK
jgi:hypothetical protein